MRRWIQEKHFREKHVNTVRRHRHRSLGDVESVSKGKRQQQQQQQIPNSVQVVKRYLLMALQVLCLKITINYLQSEIPAFKDCKIFRQSNTSPARSRRGVYDNKNAMSKAAIKRNLFGEQNEDETCSVLAQQLTDSPGGQSSCAFLMDPAIQSVKCNEFSYRAQASIKGLKGSSDIQKVPLCIPQFIHSNIYSYICFR